MKVKLISIGNSKGVRIPGSVIKQCGFGDQIEMRVGNGVVELIRTSDAREGWDAAFASMATAGDDILLYPDSIAHDWDEEDWVW